MIDIEISEKFAELYRNNKNMLDFLIESAVPRRVLLRRYELLLMENLTPIENLPQEIKNELVRECRATGLKFTNKTLIDAARILHTLKFIG